MNKQIFKLEQLLPSSLIQLLSKQSPKILRTFNQLSVNNCQFIAQSVKYHTFLSLFQKPKIIVKTQQFSFSNKKSYKIQQIVQNVPSWRPIILILCQPASDINIEGANYEYPYCAVDYCSWLQNAGAICIPLAYNLNVSSIQFLLQRSQGLLITGGYYNIFRDNQTKQNYSQFMLGFIKVMRFIQKLWNKKIHFPVWGTCLGLQMMTIFLTGDNNILSNLNSKHHTLQIYPNYKESKVFENLPIKHRISIQNYKIINFMHSHGISVYKYCQIEKLKEKLRVTAISKDKDNKWFCSAFEGKQNPIFLSQFHPQKQAYQWTKLGDTKHQQDGIQVSQFIGQFFVEQCKKCKPIKTFLNKKQFMFYSIHTYKQIHTPLKRYKVFVIDYRFKDEQSKKIKKEIQKEKSKSINGNKKSFI